MNEITRKRTKMQSSNAQLKIASTWYEKKATKFLNSNMIRRLQSSEESCWQAFSNHTMLIRYCKIDQFY